jgi:ribonucleotide reductase beta subunit family protein with ferritin-like domain
MTDLAKKSKLNVKTAKNILNSLIDRNIIKGFRYLVDANKIGVSKFRLFLKLHNLSSDIEKKFISESLPVNLIGMNEMLMKQYIEYVADYWLVKLNCEAIYNSKNPFDFMQYISLQNFGNFFETRISSYRKAGVGIEESENTFSTDQDF